MKILALEPYYGGSHRAFLDGWAALSRHDWTLLTLGANKWKWRMRIAAITFADQINAHIGETPLPDAIFCSDMLNVAEFKGLVSPRLKNVPLIVYFHENQLTYPTQVESERDYHYGVTNMTTALAADAVWFNSQFHRGEFLAALENFIKIVPKEKPQNAVERIAQKSTVNPPGISIPDRTQEKYSGPIRILWAGRWEHDKNPEDFFTALKHVKQKGIDFRLSVIGEIFRDSPKVFDWAKDYFASHIDQWGYLPTRQEYEKALCSADVIVSTANHEFFGISIVEAIAAGLYPVLPNRLAYPEIVSSIEQIEPGEFLYEGSVDTLTEKLTELSNRHKKNKLWQNAPNRGIIAMSKYKWQKRVKEMDKAISLYYNL